MNTINILEISEDLWYLIQYNMEDQVYQVQRMLADKLDEYRGWGNKYVDNNIQEIQELYRNKRQKKESERERVEDEEVILIKPYKESATTTKSSESSFIHEEIENLK